jgi:hypothetical protein
MIGAILAGAYGDVAPVGDFESIATVTVGAGGAANVEFTSIPSSYQHLQIRGIARNTFASTDINLLTLQFNNDTGSNYARHYVYGNGTSATSASQTSQTTAWIGFVPANNTTANSFSAFVCDILDYGNTNKNTTLRSLSGSDLNGSGELFLISALWSNTAAISSIKLASSSQNLAQYSHFALYGIKG